MALLERLVIGWLRTVSQKAVGEQLGLSWDEIHGIMERGWSQASSGEVEPLPLLGVDEKAFRNGHKYFTLVNDLAPLARAVRWRRSAPKPVWMDSGEG
jgi:transposase